MLYIRNINTSENEVTENELIKYVPKVLIQSFSDIKNAPPSKKIVVANQFTKRKFQKAVIFGATNFVKTKNVAKSITLFIVLIFVLKLKQNL